MKKLFILGIVFSIVGLFGIANATTTVNTTAEDTQVIQEAIEKYKNKNYLGCISDLRMEVTKDPTSTISWYYLGNAYMNISMKKEAHEAFDKVVTLNTVPKLTSYAIQAKLCMENKQNCQYQNFNSEQITALRKNPTGFLETYFAALKSETKSKSDIEIEKLIKNGYNSKIHPEASKVILQERTKMEQSRINSKAALPADNSAMAMIIESDSLNVLKETMQNYQDAE